MVRGVVRGVVACRYLPACLSEGGAGCGRVGTSSVSSESTSGLFPPPMWSCGAETFWVVSILIVASVRSLSWVSLGGADGTLVQLDHALAAKPVPCLRAATAKVMAEAPRFLGHGARFPWSARVGGLARGYPEEIVDSEQGTAGSGARVPWARVSQCVMWYNVCLRFRAPRGSGLARQSAGPIDGLRMIRL